jgi:hypothetical protein
VVEIRPLWRGRARWSSGRPARVELRGFTGAEDR